MEKNQIDPTVKGRVLALLGLNYSERAIIRQLKKENIIVSKGMIHRIKNGTGSPQKCGENKGNKVGTCNNTNAHPTASTATSKHPAGKASRKWEMWTEDDTRWFLRHFVRSVL